jgi:hypothetical protein
MEELNIQDSLGRAKDTIKVNKLSQEIANLRLSLTK